MPSFQPPSQGEQIAHLRRRLGLTQGELAARLNRSESWLSQVERGIIVVQRVSMLRTIADALQVSVAELDPEVASGPEPEPAGDDLNAVRLALTGHPALATAVLGAGVDVKPDELPGLVSDAWEAVHASRFVEAAPLLAELIPRLEVAAAQEVPDALALLASTYQAAAAAFARQDESDAAWVAADRAVATAQRMDDPLNIVAGLFRMAHVFIRLQRADQADRVIEDAASVLQPLVDDPAAPPATLSLLGAITLASAVNRASESQRSEARAALAEAAALADRLGEDRNDFATEFGPTNVQLHAIAIAVDLGDAGEALDIAGRVDPSSLSPERQGRFHIDVARAHTQRRQLGEALESLLQAEKVAPEQAHGHHLARETIDELVRLAGRRPVTELTDLAGRAGVSDRT